MYCENVRGILRLCLGEGLWEFESWSRIIFGRCIVRKWEEYYDYVWERGCGNVKGILRLSLVGGIWEYDRNIRIAFVSWTVLMGDTQCFSVIFCCNKLYYQLIKQFIWCISVTETRFKRKMYRKKRQTGVTGWYSNLYNASGFVSFTSS